MTGREDTMSLKDTVRSWIVNLLDLNDLADTATRNRIERLAELRDYYDGIHKQQLRVKPGKFNDNLTINLVGLIVDKAVSALVGDPADGHGLRWEFPSETTIDKKTKKKVYSPSKAITWLDEQWEANGRDSFLHKNAMSGAASGFPAIKLVPDGDGNIRLINLNPLLLDVNTDPQDSEKVTAYVIRYIVTENDRQVAYKEETKPTNPDSETSSWTIETRRHVSGKHWELTTPPVLWMYPFPPILVWQNLPATDSPYGRSDIEGIIPIQDRYNFLVSNLSKIIRLYAHPQRFARNLTAQLVDGQVVMGPDEMPSYTGDGDIVQLPSVGDLPGAMLFLQSLRESAFLLSREVDSMSMKDKVGAITNFALRVLYRDFLDKLGTKRMLYGAAYQELNRRILALGNYEPETCDIYWPDPLPVNEVEEIAAIKGDMELGLVSVQTAREIRNYDHEQETERMSAEKVGADNAGALLLQNFFAKGQ